MNLEERWTLTVFGRKRDDVEESEEMIVGSRIMTYRRFR